MRLYRNQLLKLIKDLEHAAWFDGYLNAKVTSGECSIEPGTVGSVSTDDIKKIFGEIEKELDKMEGLE